MSWCYYPVKYKCKVSGETYVRVHEVYMDDQNKIEFYTASAMKPLGDNKADLIRELELMLKDIKKYKPKFRRELLGLEVK